MAPLHLPKVLLLLFLFLLFTVSFVSSSSSSATLQPAIQLVGSRDLLEKKDSDGVQMPLKKNKLSTTPDASGTTLSSTNNKNNTKLIKPTTLTAPANSTKLTANKNSTKINKLQEKTFVKLKLNSTSNSIKPTSKPSNSTKPISKSSNSTKPISKSSNSTKPTSLLTQKSADPAKKNKPTIVKKEVKKSTKPVGGLTSRENDDEDDFVSEFRDLPSKFQETLLPDLEVLSTTSKAYLNKANKQISKGFNPIVGKTYAPMVASIISFAFILIPFLLVSLIFNRIKAYFSLQKLVIFIQIYLSIYFSILSLSSIVTGLEPLKFFYATSQSTYVCIQLLQTLAYVLYLLVLLMYLVLVFSTESAMASKLLGLGQTFVGFAVGLHYYMTVFHRAVLRQPPKTSWKVHAVYATCFLLICLLGTAERRKKAYVVDGSEEGKKS